MIIVNNRQISGTTSTNWYLLEHTMNPFNVSISVACDSDVSAGTISVVYSVRKDYQNTSDFEEIASQDIYDQTVLPDTNYNINLSSAVTAVKLKSNGVVGTVRYSIVQAGNK